MNVPMKSSRVSRAPAEDRTSFSLYPADLKIVNEALARLAERRLKVDRTKFVRCMLHTATELDLFAYAVVQQRDDALKAGPRETDYVAERFTIVLPLADLDKVDRVVRQLAAKGVRANESYLLRALLRRLPPGEALAPVVARYLAEFPDGRSRAARAKAP
jgi:hypothetical protein